MFGNAVAIKIVIFWQFATNNEHGFALDILQKSARCVLVETWCTSILLVG